MNSQEDAFSNPLFLKVAIGYIQANRQKLDKKSLKKHFLEVGLDANTVNLLFDDELSDEKITLPKQPDPHPTLALEEQAPSLTLYFILIVFAVILILFAFKIQKPDWAGLFVNLATEILGAVIILIIVDRRLRSRELQTLQNYAETTSVRFASLFSSEVRDVRLYAKAFDAELKRIRPENYFERPNLENLLEKHTKGFFLSGIGGIGKTTLLQTIALRQNEKTIQYPQRERILVIFPMRLFSNDANTLTEQIWQTIRQYSKLKRKWFYHWLEKGRLIIIFDGLNETSKPALVLRQIKELKTKYPHVSLIISGRSLPQNFTSFDLYKIEMSGLTEDEAKRFVSSYA